MGSEQTSAAQCGRRHTSTAELRRGGRPPRGLVHRTRSRRWTVAQQIVWQKREGGIRSYGALSTAGGLVFAAKLTGTSSLRREDGDVLWHFQTAWASALRDDLLARPSTSPWAVGGNRVAADDARRRRGVDVTLNGLVDEQHAPPRQ